MCPNTFVATTTLSRETPRFLRACPVMRLGLLHGADDAELPVTPEGHGTEA
jgi:hypothetical protein